MLGDIVGRALGRRTAPRFALFSLLVAGIGCSSASPETDANALLCSVPLGPDWCCLGQPRQDPPAQYPETVAYTFSLGDWFGGGASLNAMVKVCSDDDTQCVAPLSTTAVYNDAEMSLQIPAGKGVHFQIEALDRPPSALWLDGPLYSDRRGGEIPLSIPFTGLGLSFDTAALFDSTQGIVAVRNHDCAGNVDSGAYYSLAGATGIPFTVVSELPTLPDPPTRTSKTILPSQISNVPWAGFVNVPPGKVTVIGTRGNITADGTHGDTQRTFGEANVDVLASGFTFVEMGPLGQF